MAEATIRDVARRAQVSIASVSRALNGLNNVHPDMRERVLKAAAELGYVPHAGARSLSLARNHAIGVVLPDLHGEFFSEIVRGMDREASRRGYMLLLSNIHAGDATSGLALQAMRGRVDGLVVMAPHIDAAELERSLPASLPALLINCAIPGEEHASLRLDNAAGAEAVVRHLVEMGRRRIAHIAGPKDNADARERSEGYRWAMRRYVDGFEPVILPGEFTEQSGAAAAAAILAEPRSFDAVFAANDMMAIGCLQALKAAGVDVPDEVAIVGFDDIPLARYLGLTTVRVRIAELGEQAVSRLIDLFSRPGSATSALHHPELVVRHTTDPAAELSLGGAGWDV